MRRLRTGALAYLAASLPVCAYAAYHTDEPLQSQELSPRAQLVLSVLDKNGDGLISCEELATFLNSVIVAALRDMGIEPHTSAPVPSCGSRPVPTPAAERAALEAEEKKRRSPDKNYDEYFRALIQETLNRAQSTPNTDDAIGPDEVEKELLEKPLSLPLAGTLSDFLPNIESVPVTSKGKAWTDILEEWVNIRQSFLDEQGIGKPAKITLTNRAKDDETVEEGQARRVYAFKTAVVLTPPIVFVHTANLEISPVFAFEAHVTSDTPNRDQIVHRTGVSSLIVRNDSTAPFSSHIIDVTFDYSTNRGYAAEVYGATLQYTPQYRAIGIGQYLGRGATVDFRWRPYAGIVWSDVKKADVVEAYQKQEDFTHAYLKFSGELKITERGKVTPELTLWHGDRLLREGGVDHWQANGTLEGRFVLSQAKGVDRASFTVTFTWGRASPGFERERSALIALAAKL